MVNLIPQLTNLPQAFWVAILGSLQSGLAVLWLFIIFKRQKKNGIRKSNWERFSILFYLSLGFADLSHSIHFYLFKYAYKNTPWLMIHQGPYILSMVFLTHMAMTRSFQDLARSKKYLVFAVITAISSFYYYCSYVMVLSFPFPVGYHRPFLNWLTSYLYGILQAVSVGGLFVAGLRASTLIEMVYWFCLLSLNGSNFVLRIQDVRKIEGSILFEYSWTIALAALGVLLLLRIFKFPARKDPFDSVPTPIGSIRVLVPLSTLSILSLFVLINLTVLPYFQIANIATISGHTLSFTFAWLASNGIGIFLSQTGQKRIHFLKNKIEQTGELNDLERIQGDLVELNPIIESLKVMKGQLVATMEQASYARSLEVIADAASKLVHRIKSPLLALEMIEGGIPESTNRIYHAAIKDLKNLVEDLKKYSDHRKINSISGTNSIFSINDIKKEKLYLVLESLVGQKKIEIRNRPEIEITCEWEMGAKSLYSEISSVEVSNALSDLINNSIQAIAQSGKIKVRLVGLGDRNLIQVIDNGVGIPSDLLPKVGILGFTYGKKDGTGRGFYDAKRSIESCGGQLSISSEQGVGTVVSIEFDRVLPPHEPITKIYVPKGGTVCVVDDSLSMHHTWRIKLEESELTSNEYKLEFYKNQSEFLKWIGRPDTQEHLADVLFLMDYEFEGSTQTGLDLIESLSIGGQSILVTGLADTNQVAVRCSQLGVRLLTKNEVKSAEFLVGAGI